MEHTSRSSLIKGGGPVVLVDDDSDFLYFADMFFNESKCKNPLIRLNSGEELIAYLLAVEEGQKSSPELILLDVYMPVFDGFETLTSIKDQCAKKNIPVIVLTGSLSLKDQRKAIELGASAYDVKPMTRESYVNFFNSL